MILIHRTGFNAKCFNNLIQAKCFNNLIQRAKLNKKLFFNHLNRINFTFLFQFYCLTYPLSWLWIKLNKTHHKTEGKLTTQQEWNNQWKEKYANKRSMVYNGFLIHIVLWTGNRNCSETCNSFNSSLNYTADIQTRNWSSVGRST